MEKGVGGALFLSAGARDSMTDCGGKAVKHRPGRWLIILLACCVGGFAGVARAQVSVAVTSSVSITVAAGSSISSAGSFTVTNTSGATITISSINLSSTDGAIFSSMTLTGSVPGSSSVAAVSSPDPPGNSNTFDFSALPALPTGQAATFTLSGVASSAPSATPTPAAGVSRGSPIYAGMMPSMPFGRSPATGAALTVVLLAGLIMTGRLRRRHLVWLALAYVMAATELGCGNTTTGGVTGTSTQAVQTVTVSSGGTPTGLPANLGSITVQ
jgi:hypothetical protein